MLNIENNYKLTTIIGLLIGLQEQIKKKKVKMEIKCR